MPAIVDKELNFLKLKVVFLSLLLVVLYLVILNLIPYLSYYIKLDYEKNLALIKWFPSLLTLGSSIVLLILYEYLAKRMIRKVSTPLRWKIVLFAVFLAFIFVLFQIAIKSFFFDLGSKNEFEFWLTPALLAITFIDPIIEELIFRKIIFNKLNENFNLNFSIILSSFLFAIIHLPNLSQSLFAFIGGLIAVLIYNKNKNILYPIVFHISWNLFATIINFTF